jgi:hypothetical protein
MQLEKLENAIKQSLTGNFCGSADENADRNVDSKNYPHEVSDGNEGYIGNCTREHGCYILTGNVFSS